MSMLSKVLRKTEQGFAHKCPACNELHYLKSIPGERPFWQFDGNAEKPTFNPSVKVTSGHFVEGFKGPNCWCNYEPDEGFRCSICHYFIRNGNIEYCGDSTHSLSGKVVPLPEILDTDY